jgi:hypothetical protein
LPSLARRVSLSQVGNIPATGSIGSKNHHAVKKFLDEWSLLTDRGAPGILGWLSKKPIACRGSVQFRRAGT